MRLTLRPLQLCGPLVLIVVSALLIPHPTWPQQQETPDGPAAALSAALAAACRASEPGFATYLTADNAAAFHALPEAQRVAFLKRFSLTDGAGKTLASSDTHGRVVLRCQSPEQTVEFRFGDVRLHENLAFISVTVVDTQQVQFGLIRENGGWRLLSLGLVLLDIPQLSAQWSLEDLAQSEDEAVATLRKLAVAAESYRRAFGNLPKSLAELGPAPQNEISPEQASLIDAQLAAGSAGGYRFLYHLVSSEAETSATFELAATPDDYGKTGQKSFLLDGSGKIHGADKHGSAAALDDPLIAGEKAP
jgi:hypothetical protein